MLQPLVRRTWAPQGKTPIIENWARHDRLSVITAVTISPILKILGLYFFVCNENINNNHIMRFLTELKRVLGRDLIVVMDNLSAHKTAAKKMSQSPFGAGKYVFEWLPFYAPELNPVEFIWGHTKYSDMANFVPDNLDQLDERLDESLMNTTKELVQAAFRHAGLEI
jgi:transposase